MDQSSAGFVQHTQKRNYYFIFFKPKLLYYSVHLCRSLCRGDPRVWGTCSHRLYQRADVHHWRGGGGETVMDATSERKDFG